MTETLQHPGAVMARLLEIENDLAIRQNELEEAGLEWFKAKREREKKAAEAFIEAVGTDGQRRAQATAATAEIGVQAEAAWEAGKKVVDVLTTRAGIGQSLLKAQGRS